MVLHWKAFLVSRAAIVGPMTMATVILTCAREKNYLNMPKDIPNQSKSLVDFRFLIALLNALGKSSRYIDWRLIPS